MLENISIEKLKVARTMTPEELEERNEFYIASVAHWITNANRKGDTQIIINNARLSEMFRNGALGFNDSKHDSRNYAEIADMIVSFFTKHTDLEVSINKTGAVSPSSINRENLQPQVEIIFSWEVE